MSRDPETSEPKGPFRVGGGGASIATMAREIQRTNAVDWAAKLRGVAVFLAAAGLILVHAIWAAWFSGTDLAPIALMNQPDRSVAVERAELRFEPGMAPVEINVRVKCRGSGRPECAYELTGPEGKRVIARTLPASEPLSNETHAGDWWHEQRLARLDRLAAGPHLLRVRLAPFQGQQLLAAEVTLRRNATESHFFRNLTLLVLVFVAVRKWRNRGQSEVASQPSEAPRAGPAPVLPLAERVQRRCVLEALALLTSLARVPLAGYYTMLLVIGFFFGFGRADSARAQSIKQVFQGETVQEVLHSAWGQKVRAWVVPEGNYQGMAALWALGTSAGTVMGAVYLVTLPFRLLLPRRPPPTFRQRAKRIFYVHVGAVLLVAAWGWGQDDPANSNYEEIVIVFGAFAAMGYVPALILSTITAAIENAIERLEPPPARRS